MREAVVGSHYVSSFGQYMSQGPGRKQTAPSKAGKKSKFNEGTVYKSVKRAKRTHQTKKKNDKVLDQETVELEAAKSWGYRKGTQSPQSTAAGRELRNKHPNPPPLPCSEYLPVSLRH